MRNRIWRLFTPYRARACCLGIELHVFKNAPTPARTLSEGFLLAPPLYVHSNCPLKAFQPFCIFAHGATKMQSVPYSIIFACCAQKLYKAAACRMIISRRLHPYVSWRFFILLRYSPVKKGGFPLTVRFGQICWPLGRIRRYHWRCVLLT